MRVSPTAMLQGTVPDLVKEGVVHSLSSIGLMSKTDYTALSEPATQQLLFLRLSLHFHSVRLSF